MNITPEAHDEVLDQLCALIARLTDAKIRLELFYRDGKAGKYRDNVSRCRFSALYQEEQDASIAFWTLHRRGEEIGLLNYSLQASKPQVTNL